jgi:hypothetical protein
MTRVKVTNAFLANYVEVRDSLAYVAGAFPEWWDVPQLPSTGMLFVVVTIELQADELNTTFNFILRVDRPDSTTTVLSGVNAMRGPSLQDVHGAPYFQIIPIGSNVEFRETGRHELVLSAPDKEVARIPFAVRIVPVGTPNFPAVLPEEQTFTHDLQRDYPPRPKP